MGKLQSILRLLPFTLLLLLFIYVMSNSRLGNKPEEHWTNFGLFMLLISPVVFWCFRYIWKNRNNHLWSKGVFPLHIKFTPYNLLEAYICLLGRLIQIDRVDARKKMKYALKYFKQHFPNTKYNFSSSLSYSLKHPIRVESVANWLNRHLTEEAERIQVLYFLFGISNVDGSIDAYEIKFLKELSDLLNVHPENFDSIYAMYQRKKVAVEPQTRSELDKLHDLSCKVLGIEPTEDLDTIKSAYRKMVKTNHPDRFANQSEDQQALAHERFLQIQKAYEFLELKLG